MAAAPPPPLLIWFDILDCNVLMHEPCVRLRSLVNAASRPWCISASSLPAIVIPTSTALLPVSHHSWKGCFFHSTVESSGSVCRLAWLLQVWMVYIAIAGRCTPCVALALRMHESNALDGWTGCTQLKPAKLLTFFVEKKKEKRGARKILARSIQGVHPHLSIYSPPHRIPLFRFPVAHFRFSSYDPVLVCTLACTCPPSFFQQQRVLRYQKCMRKNQPQLQQSSEGKLECHVSVVFFFPFSEDGSFLFDLEQWGTNGSQH